MIINKIYQDINYKKSQLNTIITKCTINSLINKLYNICINKNNYTHN